MINNTSLKIFNCDLQCLGKFKFKTSKNSSTIRTPGHVITTSFLNFFNCTQITHKLKHMETVKLFLAFHVLQCRHFQDTLLYHCNYDVTPRLH